MRSANCLVVLVLFVMVGFIGCGETSIYGTWGYEDKGRLYEMRIYDDKYAEFVDGNRVSGGSFTINGNILTLTRTDGNYDMKDGRGIRNYKKDEYLETFKNIGWDEDSYKILMDNYFPIYTYEYRLTHNTLSLTNTEYRILGAKIYKKKKTSN